MENVNEVRGKRIFFTVVAIIEKEVNGEPQILLQIRWKKEGNKSFNGLLEIPGGHMEEGEDFYSALRREVKEECGLEVTEIKPDVLTKATGKFDEQCIAAVPFCINTFIGSSRVIATFVCRAKGKLIKEGLYDAKEPRWIGLLKLKEMIEKEPESFFSMCLPALKFYVQQKEKGMI